MIQKIHPEDPTTNVLSAATRSGEDRLGYHIHAFSDIPLGFELPVFPGEWSRAIFIPGSSGLSVSERYPARIYILTRDLLFVVSHSDSHEPPFITKIADLVGLASHRSRGLGELVFTATEPSRRFYYSPIQRQRIDSFLSALRAIWLRPAEIELQEIPLPSQFFPWHRFALESELDPGEALVAMLAQSEIEERRVWVFRNGPERLKTSLLLLTDRRLICLKFTEQAGTFPSSVTMQYVPRECVVAFSINAVSSRSDFVGVELRLKSSHRWSLNVKKREMPSLEGLLKALPCSLRDSR